MTTETRSPGFQPTEEGVERSASASEKLVTKRDASAKVGRCCQGLPLVRIRLDNVRLILDDALRRG